MARPLIIILFGVVLALGPKAQSSECGAGQKRCDPQIFGADKEGQGHCVPDKAADLELTCARQMAKVAGLAKWETLGWSDFSTMGKEDLQALDKLRKNAAVLSMATEQYIKNMCKNAAGAEQTKCAQLLKFNGNFIVQEVDHDFQGCGKANVVAEFEIPGACSNGSKAKASACLLEIDPKEKCTWKRPVAIVNCQGEQCYQEINLQGTKIGCTGICKTNKHELADGKVRTITDPLVIRSCIMDTDFKFTDSDKGTLQDEVDKPSSYRRFMNMKK